MNKAFKQNHNVYNENANLYLLQTNNQEQPDQDNGGGDDSGKEEVPVQCDYGEWEDSTECSVKCGRGTKHQIRRSSDSRCNEITQQVECMAAEVCRNKGSIGIPFVLKIKILFSFMIDFICRIL